MLIKFSFCDPSVLTELLVSFYMSYGCAPWSLDSCVIEHLDVCKNNNNIATEERARLIQVPIRINRVTAPT